MKTCETCDGTGRVCGAPDCSTKNGLDNPCKCPKCYCPACNIHGGERPCRECGWTPEECDEAQKDMILGS